ncbi:MAG: peptidoglycan editing factor PgeF [Candidatus Omnitrophica bacterium]|nr:peptidoglycan editing factor PgeF [Candidatus Omnitrophota bacterium]
MRGILPAARDSGIFLLRELSSPRAVFAFNSGLSNNMSFSHGDTSRSPANREEFLKGLDIDHRDLVCAKQVHGCGIRYATEADKGKGALSRDTAFDGTDALITDRRGVPLAVFTADCLSVFLFDTLRPAIGVVHAGWRSTAKRIVAETVRAMQKHFNTDPAHLCAGFGPAIRGCCYEVGPELAKVFPDDVSAREGRHYLDLAAANKRQLLESGVSGSRILDPGYCTFCGSGRFFSYRKSGESCGRIMSVAMLR